MHVGAAAEVGEGVLRVGGDLLALRQLRDELQLVGLVLEHLPRLGAVHDRLREGVAAGDDGAHLLLDDRQVLRGQRARQVEVVVEPVIDGRPDGQLRVGEHLEHRLGHHVRKGVPDLEEPGLFAPLPCSCLQMTKPLYGCFVLNACAQHPRRDAKDEKPLGAFRGSTLIRGMPLFRGAPRALHRTLSRGASGRRILDRARAGPRSFRTSAREWCSAAAARRLSPTAIPGAPSLWPSEPPTVSVTAFRESIGKMVRSCQGRVHRLSWQFVTPVLLTPSDGARYTCKFDEAEKTAGAVSDRVRRLRRSPPSAQRESASGTSARTRRSASSASTSTPSTSAAATSLPRRPSSSSSTCAGTRTSTSGS